MRNILIALFSVMLLFSGAVSAEAGKGFGGVRIYKAPSFRPSAKPSFSFTPKKTFNPPARVTLPPKPSMPAPVTVVKPSVKVQPQGGGDKSFYANRYTSYGYHPSERQTSFFSSPWFWMYMMSGHHSQAAAPTTVTQTTTADAQTFEQNCRKAATDPDKPATLDVKPEDCPELAKQAFAKVQAEDDETDSISPTPSSSSVPSPPVQVSRPDSDSGSDFMLWLVGGVLALIVVGGGVAVFSSPRR